MIPEIISSGKKKSTTQIIPIFITKPKRPRVRILKGKVIKFRSGLIKKLIKPKTQPANNSSLVPPVNITPETNLIANQKLKTPIIT